MNLPPPDPREPFTSAPGITTLVQPVTVFFKAASPETQQLAGVILRVRPGLLFVA